MHQVKCIYFQKGPLHNACEKHYIFTHTCEIQDGSTQIPKDVDSTILDLTKSHKIQGPPSWISLDFLRSKMKAPSSTKKNELQGTPLADINV